jgi:large conductance mechanosensitive channel
MRQEWEGFVSFIRRQGVPGLAVGFIVGGAVSKLVTSIVTDLINPFIGLLLGFAGNLAEQYTMVGKAKVTWGHFLAIFIDFLVVAVVVYYGVKLLGLDNKKEDEKALEKDSKPKKDAKKA